MQPDSSLLAGLVPWPRDAAGSPPVMSVWVTHLSLHQVVPQLCTQELTNASEGVLGPGSCAGSSLTLWASSTKGGVNPVPPPAVCQATLALCTKANDPDLLL